MTPEQKAARDAIRAATVGAPAVRKSLVVEWKGVQCEVRRPGIDRQIFIDKVSTSSDGTTDRRKQLFLGLISCVFVPGTDIQVFEPADEDNVLSRDAGKEDFVGFFMSKISELNTEATLENVEKN